MTETDRKNFLGIPVHGDITRGSSRREQKPLEELAPLLSAVLADPTIVEFGWKQYTPYFDDGDVCEFDTRGFWVRTVENAADEVKGEEFSSWELEPDSNKSLGERPFFWNGETRDYEYGPYEGPDEDRYDRVAALESAILGGSFENVLLETFGDHALVTVKKGRIDVMHYDHD